MSTTLVHVGVRASDLQATIRFWRDGLGLPVFSQRENCYDLSDGFHNYMWMLKRVGGSRSVVIFKLGSVTKTGTSVELDYVQIF